MFKAIGYQLVYTTALNGCFHRLTSVANKLQGFFQQRLLGTANGGCFKPKERNLPKKLSST